MPDRPKLAAFLLNRHTDKALALLAIIPSLASLYTFVLQLMAGHFDPFSLGIAFWCVFTVVPMLIRRTATRVSVSPLAWFVTAGRTYWPFLLPYLIDRAHTAAVAPMPIIAAVFWLSISVMVYSRIDLGRNVSFVPARRELVSTGVYGWVRHPIHTGQLLFYIAYLLRYFSLESMAVIGAGMAFVIAKTLVEESFLSEDEDYREYARKVPYRWIPGIV
jgi:protein-S-isoprenylcysteine O-methyltransferase Ste14